MAHDRYIDPESISPLKYAKKAVKKRAKDRRIKSVKKAQELGRKKHRLTSDEQYAKKRYGVGSRRHTEARRKNLDFIKSSPDRIKLGKELLQEEADYKKDTGLIDQYGADAMKARGFGTTYPKVKRKGGGPAKKKRKKSKVFSGDAYVKEVNHYKDM
mgnify:CR=1 FL=1